MRVEFKKLDALGSLFLKLKQEFSKAVKKEEYDVKIFESNLYAYYSAIHEEIRENILIESLNVDKYINTIRIRIEYCYSELARALVLVRCPYNYKAVAFDNNRFDEFPEEYKFISKLYDEVWRSYFMSLYFLTLRFDRDNKVLKQDYQNYFPGRTATVDEMIANSTVGKVSDSLPKRLFGNNEPTIQEKSSDGYKLTNGSNRPNSDCSNIPSPPHHRVAIFAHNFRSKATGIKPISTRQGWIDQGIKEGVSGKARANKWYTTIDAKVKQSNHLTDTSESNSTGKNVFNPPTIEEIPAIMNLLKDCPPAQEIAKTEILKLLKNHLDRLEVAKKYLSNYH